MRKMHLYRCCPCMHTRCTSASARSREKMAMRGLCLICYRSTYIHAQSPYKRIQLCMQTDVQKICLGAMNALQINELIRSTCDTWSNVAKCLPECQ